MQTLPMPLSAMASADDGLADFRIGEAAEIATLLRRLCDGSVALNLNGPDGASVSASLWTVDAERGVLSFGAEAGDPRWQSLLEGDEAVVVAYLDNVKLQFDVTGLLLVHGGRSSALNCAMPREVFRFQRRESFRVRPLLRAAPTAHLRHPAMPEMQLALRVLDVSIGGCALFLPDDVPPFEPGVLLNGVAIELDPDARFAATLRLQHVTAINPDSPGVRLGCEMIKLASDGQRALQRYIDQTQKRRRLLER